MRFVARLASSPRVTTLELPRPSTRDDPPPASTRRRPPPRSTSATRSTTTTTPTATVSVSSRARPRRRVVVARASPIKRHPKKVHRRRARPRARRCASAPTRARRRHRNPNHRSTTTTTTTPSRAVDSRRRARRGSSLKRTATALRRAVRPSRPPARRARRVRTRAARASPAVRRRFVYRRRAARPLTTREDEPSSARPNFPYVRTDTLPPYESVRIPRSRGGRDESDSSRASREPIETLDPSARALEREAIRARARRPAHDDAPHERCLDEVKENPARRPRADPPRRACNSRSAGSRAT